MPGAADALSQALAGIASATYSELELSSNLFPPVVVSLVSAIADPPGWFSRWARFTVTLRGPAGQQVFAPNGLPHRHLGAAVAAGSLASLVAAGVLIGRALK